MQLRSCDEQSACPSVKRVICDKVKKTYAHILISYESSVHLVLWRKNG